MDGDVWDIFEYSTQEQQYDMGLSHKMGDRSQCVCKVYTLPEKLKSSTMWFWGDLSKSSVAWWWNQGIPSFLADFSPPARWGLLDLDARLLSLVVLPPLLPPSFLAGPHLPALDRSDPRRLAGPPLPALDRNGPHRTSTGESLSAVGFAGPQPARFEAHVGLAGPQRAGFGALWASPVLNRRDSARRGPRRTSTGP